ncbi:MAG: hypothetical protein QM765_29265 [Myxococcales bacterium]
MRGILAAMMSPEASGSLRAALLVVLSACTADPSAVSGAPDTTATHSDASLAALDSAVPDVGSSSTTEDAGSSDATPGADAATIEDAGGPDATEAADAGEIGDAGEPDAGGFADAGLDGGAPDGGGLPGHYGFAKYTILPGAHAALVEKNGAPKLPRTGLVTLDHRSYQFIFDSSAAYTLTNPTDPADQLDWNKLPGLSDCGQLDLAEDGLMFGWRWRPDLVPPQLEIAHYANNDGTHLCPPSGLIALDADDLAAETPLDYELLHRRPREREVPLPHLGADARTDHRRDGGVPAGVRGDQPLGPEVGRGHVLRRHLDGAFADHRVRARAVIHRR